MAAGWMQPRQDGELASFLRAFGLCLEEFWGASWITWCHVKGHSGHLWNEVADRLANFGRESTTIADPEWLDVVRSSEDAHLAWLWAVKPLKCRDPTLPPLRGHHVVHESHLPHLPQELSLSMWTHQDTPASCSVLVTGQILVATANDAEIDQPAPLPTGQFPCDHCDRICPTKQSLAAHVYKQHQTHSIEWQYVQSSVCPGCLRNFWTSRRLQQHLRYRRNRCFDKVHGTREHVEGVSVSLDPAFKHLKRLQVYRDVHGPLRPTPAQRHRAVLQGQIVVHLWDFPLLHQALLPLDSDRLLELDNRLTPLARLFCQDENPDLCVLHSQCLTYLQELFDQDSVAAFAFMDWLWAHRLDGDHFPMAAFVTLALDFGHWLPFQQLRQWQAELELVEEEPTFPVVGRKAAQGYVDRRHFLPGRFTDLAAAEAHRRQRQGDFQHFAEIILKDVPGYMIISLDTAVSTRMNIFEEATWSFLWAAAREGHIAALLMGPPCESWSEVRYMQLLTSEGQLRRGPRPLRSFDCLWGLPLLSLREYAQLHLGNQLLLRGLWLGIMTRFRQGKVIVEHPRAPEDLDRPTIWRSAIIEHLCATSMFTQHTVLQYRYGAKGVKPTTLLCGGVRLSRLDSWARDDFVKPSTALVGVDHTGRFRTFVAKEYPMLLNAAFAHSMLFNSRFVPDPSAAQPEWALLAKDFELAARQTRLTGVDGTPAQYSMLLRKAIAQALRIPGHPIVPGVVIPRYSKSNGKTHPSGFISGGYACLSFDALRLFAIPLCSGRKQGLKEWATCFEPPVK
eukprot:Skav219506  [mRNA]  locus=scaffold5760:83309:90543:- [translate_table: standard]